MTDSCFSVVLSMVVPPVVNMLMKRLHLSEKDAITAFYTSHVYEALSQEELKAWHYGPATLCEMFIEELNTGTFEWPEEAC